MLLASSLGCLQAYAADPAERAQQLRLEIQPLLEQHCFDCHSGEEADAGLALDHFDTPISFLKGRSVWKLALQKMQIGEMPPPEDSELSDADRNKLIGWINETIEDFECGLQPNPGHVTLRRLNAAEYQNTVRDLLGINYSPAEDFPGDDVGYGFDNIGDVLTLPPILMEKYLVAAEKISRYVIKSPPTAEVYKSKHNAASLETNDDSKSSGGTLTLSNSKTIATLREQIPRPGKYTVTITASGDQVGNEPCVMVVGLDDKVVQQVKVPNERGRPGQFSVVMRMRAGSRKIQFGFANDFYRKAEGGQAQQDRNLAVHHIEITEQKSGKQRVPASELSPYHRAIIFDPPRSESEYPAKTRKILLRLASRAFRRPVADEDLDRLVKLAEEVQEDGSFEESIQVALQAILISPQFLFRVEPPRQPAAFSEFRDLDEFELASRLSYFLWSSMPDDELFRIGTDPNRSLRDPVVLRQQIRRMVADNRSNEFVKNFASQWLTLRRLDGFSPDEREFPQWNKRVETLAKFETLKFFHAVMREDMSVLRLLDAEFTYLNEELADFYGIDGVQGTKFVRVPLGGTARAGLLTQASVLAVTSNPTRTSPVQRGKWILENLLDSPPPPAPAGVPELAEKGPLVGSLREQLEQHRADPACAGCHKLMDPLGFALENFDAIGRYREMENGQPIDARGELPDGTSVMGAQQLRAVLVAQHKEQFVECLATKMLTYALGRGLEYYDKCAVDKILATLKQDDYRFSTLIFEIVSSDPFQKKGSRPE
ncbi:MAG TPA: filamin [Planctomycetaceae bacterium]|nr:filamin [Planctomycetaceae bacterium]